tara:strand:+ start:7750 stop:7998 length:249 start_codon:yes stop_codon:yes gene_type:complete
MFRHTPLGHEAMVEGHRSSTTPKKESLCMDFASNDLILVVIAMVVIVLARTLIKASSEINSSDKFPTPSKGQEDKPEDENLS